MRVFVHRQPLKSASSSNARTLRHKSWQRREISQKNKTALVTVCCSSSACEAQALVCSAMLAQNAHAWFLRSLSRPHPPG